MISYDIEELADHDLPIKNWLHTALQPGDVFWDIGAHVGSMARIGIEHGAETVAIEPNPFASSRLIENVPEATIIVAAAWRKTGEFLSLWFNPDGNTGDVRALREPSTRVRVSTVSIDDLAKTLPPPSILKIDAQGAEGEILYGGERTLAETRAILLEISDDHLEQQGTSREKIRQWLEERDWLIVPFNHWNWLAVRQ